MSYFLLLLLSTAIILALTVVIWRRTKTFSFVLGIFFLFYWGLAGSWIFYFDAISGFQGAEIGLHYYYIFDVLFKVKLDHSFLLAIVFHAAFIISIQLSVLLFYRKKADTVNRILIVDYKKLALIGLLAFLCSNFFIYDEIIEAYRHNKILYHVVELTENRFFSLHQLFLQISITATVFLFGLLLSPKARKIKLNIYGRKAYFYGFLLIGIVLPFLTILGNKKELLFAGMLTILFFLDNNKKNASNFKRLGIITLIIILPLFSTDIIRGKQFRSLLNLDIFGTKTEVEKKSFKPSDIVGAVLFSNELFFANFSMYGAIEKNVPVNTGISIKYLGASMVPRAIKNERPADVYSHYAKGVGADLESGQGYTIHHATAWMLNFGKIGIILGGLFIGFIWGKLSSLSLKRKGTTFKKIIIFLAPAITCAYLPILIRSGIESYKGFFIEGILFSCLIIYISIKDVFKKTSSNELQNIVTKTH